MKHLKTAIQIIDGWSSVESKRFGVCEIRHPTIRDDAEFQDGYSIGLELAQKKKIPLQSEALEILEKRGLWKKEDETKIFKLNASIKGAKESLEKIIPEQRKLLEDDILKMSKELDEILERKNKKMIPCAEDFASKIAYESYIPLLFIKPKYSKEDIEYLDDAEMNELLNVFIIMQGRFSTLNIKQAALEASLQNLISLSGKVHDFFGKPLIDLTNFQSQLLFHLKNYNYVIGELKGKVDEDMFKDAVALEEWIKAGEENRDRLEQQWGKSSGKFSSSQSIKEASKKGGERINSLQAIKGLL